MNASKAKKIRKAIYGTDYSIRDRIYEEDSSSRTIINKPGSRRAVYQSVKKENQKPLRNSNVKL